MKVKKASGEYEEFKTAKYLKSVKEAGASNKIAEEILEEVEKSLVQNISTDKISEKTAKLLSKRDMRVATNYNLKRGLALLGPAGFLFEHFISELLRREGFKNRRNVFMKGKCVTHEIDIVASEERSVNIIELKYHNNSETKTHVDVIMYAYARLLDIAPDADLRSGKKDGKARKMWVITNTRFTSTAIQYAACQDIRLLAWDYPKNFGLRDIILEHNLYPVSAIPIVTKPILEKLAERHILLASDLCKLTPKEFASIANVPFNTASDILNKTLLCTVDYDKKNIN